MLVKTISSSGTRLLRCADALGGAGRHFGAATTRLREEPRDARAQAQEDDPERTDPFTLKLQRQTEASYLELLAKKGADGWTKEEEEAEAEAERRSKERGEWGGPKGPEPTRFGDWEKAGRCTDF